MKLQQIKVLVQVAESGSIRAAARHMNISQSALTRALRELENDLGSELLIRSYRGVQFTIAGSALLKRARLILQTIETAKNEIAQLQGGKGAKVAIGIASLVAATLFPWVYRQFIRQLPDAQLQIAVGLLSTITPGLIEGKLDLGVSITTQAALPSELSFTPLCKVKTMVAGREGHPLAEAESWREILSVPWILNLTKSSSGNLFLSWMKSEHLGIPKQIVRVESPQLMYEMMRRTDLIGFSPARMLQDSSSPLGIVPFRVRPLPPKLTLGIIRVRGVPLTPAAAVLETLILRAIGHYGREFDDD